MAPPVRHDDLQTIVSELEGWIWTRFQYPVIQSLFSAAVGVALIPFFRWVRRRLHIGPYYSLMHCIFGPDARVPLVVPNIRTTGFQVLKAAAASVLLPENVSFIGVQEAMAVADLQQKLASSFPEKTYPLETPPNFHIHQFSFFCIGGPFANELTDHLLNVRAIVSQFMLQPPAAVATDLQDNTTYSARRAANPNLGPDDQPLLNDYGFIIIVPNPYNSSKKICVLFGLWPQGSQAAIHYILKPPSSTPLEKKFLKLAKSRTGVFGVVTTNVIGLSQGDPHLVKARVP